MKISEMSTSERDHYICRQSAAVMRASGYVMPEKVAMDFLFDTNEATCYRFDVLLTVYNCIAYAFEHKRNDTAIKEAFENLLIDTDAVHVDRLTDALYLIANSAVSNELEPIL